MLDIQLEKQGDTNIIDLEGEVTTSSSTELEEQLSDLLEAGESTFVVGCNKLELITSAGLRVLLAFAKKLQKKQGKLVLGGMTATVYEVFEMTGFTDILNILPSREEALSSLTIDVNSGSTRSES